MGWSLVVIATAYSILGGFPEVTYFDGLLAMLWAAWRLTSLPPAILVALCRQAGTGRRRGNWRSARRCSFRSTIICPTLWWARMPPTGSIATGWS